MGGGSVCEDEENGFFLPLHPPPKYCRLQGSSRVGLRGSAGRPLGGGLPKDIGIFGKIFVHFYRDFREDLQFRRPVLVPFLVSSGNGKRLRVDSVSSANVGGGYVCHTNVVGDCECRYCENDIFQGCSSKMSAEEKCVQDKSKSVPNQIVPRMK